MIWSFWDMCVCRALNMPLPLPCSGQLAASLALQASCPQSQPP